MAEPWLPNAEIVDGVKDGGSYDGAPFRIVLHTVEGDPGSVDGCRSMAASHGSPPQLWYHPTLRWLGQTLPLDRSGYALGHPSGTPETNKAGALQCELFGFADQTPGWGVELDNIGRDVVGPIVAAGWPVNLDLIAATTGSDGYGSSGAVRFGWDQWSSWNGVCVHANVPGNDHWDCGAVDLARIVRAARGAQPEPEPDLPEDDDMPTFLFAPSAGGDGRWWFTDLRTNSRPCDTLDDAVNVDYHLRMLAGLPGLVCNRDAAGAVAGPIEVERHYLETITRHAAAAAAP